MTKFFPKNLTSFKFFLIFASDMITLYIKNLVCDRCKMAVSGCLEQLGLHPLSVELGEVKISEDVLPDEEREKLSGMLKNLGFELLTDRRQQTLNQIKSLLITLVRQQNSNTQLTLSEYLSRELHSDYSALSKLFSECTGQTIEHYYMLLRVERVKELLKYDELSLTQIALKMNYSSVAYLSSQFKTITGMTPTEFKRMDGNTRKELDKI